ncbi:MAG: phage holin family protein [Betaproteobacteria bacterium]
MGLRQSLLQLGASAALVLRQRLEMFALDLEEEILRIVLVVLGGLLALMLAFLALVFAGFAVVVVYWDVARVQAIVGVFSVFALGCMIVLLQLRSLWRKRAPFFQATLAELRKDLDLLASRATNPP